TEPCDDFVKNQQCTMLSGSLLQHFEEARLRWDATTIAEQWFANYRRDFSAVSPKCPFHSCEVVPSGNDHIVVRTLSQGYRDWCSAGSIDFRQCRMVTHQDTVSPAMVVSLKLQELLPSRESVSVIGLLISVFIGVALVSKEMDKRTLYALLAKPVRRWEFLLGKFGGLVLTLAVNTAAMALGLLLVMIYVKHSLERGDAAVLVAVYFILLKLTLIVALALLF